MSKARSTGNIGNIIKTSTTCVTVTDGTTDLLIMSGSGRVTIPGDLVVLGGIAGSSAESSSYSLSSSFATNANLLDGIDGASFLQTGSFNTFSSSIDTTIKNKLNGDGVISGSVQVDITSTTGYSTFSSSLSSSIGSLSGSVATTTSGLSSSIGSLSSSVATNTSGLASRIGSVETKTGSYATTGSNIFVGSQVITGSLYITNDMVVQGCSCLQNITASAVSIGTNIVMLNTATPAVRFAGISVQDSGSNAGVTGSIFWDGLCNKWIYSNPSNVGYSGGMLISGPRNTGTIGSEAPLTCNYIAKSGGGDHLYDSCIVDDGTTVCINANLRGSSVISGTSLRSNTVGTFAFNTVNNGEFQIYATALDGMIMAGRGSSNDMVITNKSGSDVFRIPTGTINTTFLGNITTNGGIIGNNSNHLYLSSNSAAGEISFWGNQLNTRLITITGCGCMGIGTSAPISSLQICAADGQFRLSGDARAQMILGTPNKIWQFETSCATGNVQPGAIGIVEGGSGTKFQILPGGIACFQNTICTPSISIGSSIIAGVSYSTGAQISISTGAGSQTTANITDAGTGCGFLTILTQGGTAGNGSAIILGSDTWGSSSSKGQVALKTLLTDGSGCGVSDLAFSLRNSSTCSNLTERMRITSSGNVGIGTSPGSILHVKGGTVGGADFGAELRVWENSFGAVLQGFTYGTTAAFLGNFRYNINTPASSVTNYYQAGHGILFHDGVHILSSNPGGTSGGAFTPAKRLTVTNSGAVCLSSSIRATLYCMAPNGTNQVYSIVDSDATYAGNWSWQAGGGSAGYGGSVIVYGHSHATRPGFISAGISSGSGGKFTVMSSGNGSGSDMFTVNASGTGTLVGALTQNTSDKRLKNNVKNIDNAISKVMALNGVTFDWNDIAVEYGWLPRIKNNDIGVLAQEVQSVLPQAIDFAPFDRDESNQSRSGQNYLTVQYEKIIPLLIESIKEQQCTINTLKSCLGIN